MNSDEIHICGLEVSARIGVTEAERAAPQTLRVDAVFVPRLAFGRMGDDLGRTIDYDAAARCLRELAAARPRNLIETLAAEMADCLLGDFGARQATVEIRKYVLPGTDHVAVRTLREQSLDPDFQSKQPNQERLVHPAKE